MIILRRCLILLLPLVAGCQHAAMHAVPDEAVSIMTFNVENLFDNVDDPGKDDRTYLPLAAKQNAAHRAACNEIGVDRWREQCLYWDWSDALVERKLALLAQTILQINDGRGPDILALQEVENVSILNRLRHEYLQAAAYREPVLIEGTDLRGIDVAFLTRLAVVGDAKLHPLNFDEQFAERVADTRGILQATFELPGGDLLTGFAVHFPAPFHPTEMRIAAYENLTALLAALPAERPAFAAGDFNTTSAENRDKNMLARFVRPQWTVAHELGCGENCRGTSYYARDDSWSFLDMILWSPPRAGAASWDIQPGSIRIANEFEEQRQADGTPKRFDGVTMRGVSDHWPMILTLEQRRN
ncbi:MAG: endonuclease/exonuclease/phosphatase family protein [Woeseia sp.]|nr:endonuclease/exonuclease/phosphatase family protein [Woeseia sp.]NNE61980.1 endonuclease/exonuclease/phosphatase family protein [Woeseia sp.]NNL55610.1 endonuclease/exonuclease/phosphatase family protein [Woeseia sp.]